ncbi:hypothetical protein NHX12_021658 [Muraenolepis orangiensis]|uniref:Uncharacterized protein n=1 Tax=Muraenolepis orangiensis TaxID=630683 RepID=A0A9Q0EU43_9TELE|nr:hypothetical protein NHX12_021658 [Muraenolepis orangiensis]
MGGRPRQTEPQGRDCNSRQVPCVYSRRSRRSTEAGSGFIRPVGLRRRTSSLDLAPRGTVSWTVCRGSRRSRETTVPYSITLPKGTCPGRVELHRLECHPTLWCL